MTEFEDVALLDDAMDQPTGEATFVAGPDRAEAPVSEVTERFLRSIISRVPLDRIEELHLFAPLRQGTTETGIAVIAARVPIVPVDTAVEDNSGATAEESPALIPEAGEPDCDAEDVTIQELQADDSPYLSVDAESGEPMGELFEVLGDEGADDELPESASGVVAVMPRVRHTVYTARYRLVLKGPERGTWEAEVVDEADAPLITVETVVRGVQRRAGGESEILRYSDRQIARALRMEWPLPST